MANKKKDYENVDMLEQFGAVMLRSQMLLSESVFTHLSKQSTIQIEHKHRMVLLLTCQCSRARITVHHCLQVAFMLHDQNDFILL